jgi:hypothetical protein
VEWITDRVASKESRRAIKAATSGIEIGAHGKGAVIDMGKGDQNQGSEYP